MSSSHFNCTFCHRGYSSKNHLRRHEASHNPESLAATCEFCGRKYSRKDALRRHYQSCSRIGIQPKPGPNKRGPPRRACDNCARNRSTCDGDAPCATCKAHMRYCSYRRLGDHPNGPVISDLNTPRVLTRSQTAQRSTLQNQQPQGKVLLPFLLNYSDSSIRHAGDVNHVLSLLSTTEKPEESPDAALPSLELGAERESAFAEDSYSIFFASLQSEKCSRNSPAPEGLNDSDKRHAAATNILDCLLQIYSANPGTWQDFNMDHAREFFQESNFYDATIAYFEETVRPRSRIVPKPSFDLHSMSAPLLLSVFLMGATCGVSADLRCQALEYADIAEAAIFENPSFLRLAYETKEVDCYSLQKEDIEIIQAAILMILVQISSPKAEHRRRVRIQRYPALVSVARITGLTRIKNIWHDPDSFLCHERFLKNETCIRLMASISMIDCHFIMFQNVPPNFTVKEFNFDLPAEEQGIDILDEIEWSQWAINERKYRRPPCLSQLLNELLSDTWTGPEDPRFENIGVFALWIVISAFHPMVFQLRSIPWDTTDATKQIERALERWNSLWERLQSKLTQDQIYRAGFMTHAPDLWNFAKILLRTPLHETGDIARGSMARVNRLLRRPSK